MHTHHKKHATPALSGPTGPTTPTNPAVAPAAKAQLVTAENIRLCAYRKWESAGRPTGDGVQFWLEAEKEMKVGK